MRYLATVAEVRKTVDVAVILPIYNNRPTLDELLDRLISTLEGLSLSFEIVLVDDRGPEPVWEAMVARASSDTRIRLVRLSRNFGQHPAITAGIDAAQANWYVVMDADLQDQPEALEKLWNKAQEPNTDVVIARRVSQELGARRQIGSRLFNFALMKLADIPASSEIGNFRICSAKVMRAFREYDESMRLFPALMSHLGFSVAYVDVPRPSRASGQSSYTFKKLFTLGVDAIISNSFKPMIYLASSGFIISILATLAAMTLVIRKIFFGVTVEGWASLMTAIALFSGVQIFVVSFVGIYIGKVFFEVKKRPHYIVEEHVNLD